MEKLRIFHDQLIWIIIHVVLKYVYKYIYNFKTDWLLYFRKTDIMQAFEILLRQTQDFPLSCIAYTHTTDTLATEREGMVVTHFAHTIPVSVPGPCITNVISTCRKNFSQWASSFLWKLRCHRLKFLRRVAKTLVIQGPEVSINKIYIYIVTRPTHYTFCHFTSNDMQCHVNLPSMDCISVSNMRLCYRCLYINRSSQRILVYITAKTFSKGLLLINGFLWDVIYWMSANCDLWKEQPMDNK